MKEYSDVGISGLKARRPGLDALIADARQRKFSVVLVAAFDRLARSTKHFLLVVEELDSLGIELVSKREGLASGDAMGRLFMTIISAITELERSLVAERVKSGMRRARLEGRRIGRARLDVNREQVIQDRRSGMSLTQVARKHGISRASVCRLVREANDTRAVPAFAPKHAGASKRGSCLMEQKQIEVVGKVFLVVGDKRKCLICEGTFTPTQAAAHAIAPCYPQPSGTS